MNKDLSFEHQMKVLLYYYDKLVKENERNPQRRKLLFSFEDIDRMVEPCLSEKRRTRDKINLSYRYKVELNMNYNNKNEYG